MKGRRRGSLDGPRRNTTQQRALCCVVLLRCVVVCPALPRCVSRCRAKPCLALCRAIPHRIVHVSSQKAHGFSGSER